MAPKKKKRVLTPVEEALKQALAQLCFDQKVTQEVKNNRSGSAKDSFAPARLADLTYGDLTAHDALDKFFDDQGFFAGQELTSNEKRTAQKNWFWKARQRARNWITVGPPDVRIVERAAMADQLGDVCPEPVMSSQEAKDVVENEIEELEPGFVNFAYTCGLGEPG